MAMKRRSATMKRKSGGGSLANSAAPVMKGGKRKTRKLSPWNKFVAKVYAEMKKMDKNAKFADALKEAAKRKKAGKM
jgi:hypothetical protein